MPYHSKYGLYDCWKCLCEVCTRAGCPKNILWQDALNHCLRMRQRQACPTVKCDWFQHKEIHMVLRVKRRYQAANRIKDKLDEILRKLDKLSPD